MDTREHDITISVGGKVVCQVTAIACEPGAGSEPGIIWSYRPEDIRAALDKIEPRTRDAIAGLCMEVAGWGTDLTAPQSLAHGEAVHAFRQRMRIDRP